ncbi:MAG: hypothetical protein IT384_32955 [Deltaproteobacteria bacterium]|nr:hypothetical protein [Deltaproteobacteria bacterium]
MGEVFSFDGGSRAALLAELAGREVPLLLRIVPHGAARGLAKEIVLRTRAGRLVQVVVPDLPVARALVRWSLIDSGRIEISTDELPRTELGTLPLLGELCREAEAKAQALRSILAPIGGLDTWVVTQGKRLMLSANELARPALELARLLVDVPRPVADVFDLLVQDELQTARLLDQLRDAGVLETVVLAPAGPSQPPPRRSLPPTRASFAPRPGRRERRATAGRGAPRPAAVAAESGVGPRASWDALPDEPLVPATEAVSSAPAAIAPARPAGAGAIAPAPVEALGDLRSPAQAADDDLFRAAGLGRSSPPVARVWLGALLLLVGVVIAVSVARDRDRATPPVVVAPPAPVAAPPAPTSSTSTSGAASNEYSLSRPPPLAGPEADRRLREAEALINQRAYARAEEILSEMRTLRAEDATVWLLSGQLEVERGRFEIALGFVDHALEIEPLNYRGHVLKGSVRQFQGSAGQAVVSYRRALEIDPRHVMSPELRVVAEEIGQR